MNTDKKYETALECALSDESLMIAYLELNDTKGIIADIKKYKEQLLREQKPDEKPNAINLEQMNDGDFMAWRRFDEGIANFIVHEDGKSGCFSYISTKENNGECLLFHLPSQPKREEQPEAKSATSIPCQHLEWIELTQTTTSGKSFSFRNCKNCGKPLSEESKPEELPLPFKNPFDGAKPVPDNIQAVINKTAERLRSSEPTVLNETNPQPAQPKEGDAVEWWQGHEDTKDYLNNLLIELYNKDGKKALVYVLERHLGK